VVEAAAHGADAILLIVAILEEARLRAFRELAAELGMAALVEVHDAAELEIAVRSGAEIIGVNNRDLRTFQVSLETSIELAARIPHHLTKVSESGIFSSADVHRVMAAGFDAVLVGEHLVRSGDPTAALRDLRS
jgi:indole-3-glycerol phosphate synthase